MPEYTWRCSSNHVTREHRSLRKFTDTVKCECGKTAEWFLESPSGFNSSPLRIWLASEVHGKKKAQSDEFRADLEEAALKGDPVPKDVQEAIEKTRTGANR